MAPLLVTFFVFSTWPCRNECPVVIVAAYGNLGSVLSAQGRVAEAEEAFVQALRYRPNMADVHYNL